MKIVTLTLNPALDKSTQTSHLAPEQKLRCTPMQLDAGGGGINVSKGIKRLSGDSTAVFLSGGHNGQTLSAILRQAEIDIFPVSIASETRENISVTALETNQQYRFTTSGLPVTLDEANACLTTIKSLKPDLLVASGSLPAGLPDTYYEELAAFANRAGIKMVLDTSGPALQAAADEGLFLLKPNIGELCILSGVESLELSDVDDAARDIIHQGKCEIVVVSLGAQGAILVTKDQVEHIPAPNVRKVSTVGAGDSMVAGMIWAYSQEKSLVEMVQTGVACGSAATMNAGTRLFQVEDAHKLLKWMQQNPDRNRFTAF